MKPTIKPGDRFTHRHWLNAMDKQPLPCEVTKTTREGFYYRPVYGTHDDGTPWVGSSCYVRWDRAFQAIADQTPAP